MNKAEWLACNDPYQMLHALGGRAGERPLRLFACACLRRVLPLLGSDGSIQAIELTERFAEGLASRDNLFSVMCSSSAGSLAALPGGMDAARNAAWIATFRARLLAPGRDEGPAQCDLLRDLFNPFYRARLTPSLLSWNDGCVRKLAEAIYAERRFADLPILADALEDAGCDDGAVLEHCRGPGVHVRGCWVLDLIAGKE